ncbi:MAG TPA: LPXTG cell wall anchor domain-containing protein [Nocardioidaceae bacterium]
MDKAVDGATSRRIAEGESATVDYRVEVTPSAPKDSDFEVTGQVGIGNPNNVAISGVTVSASAFGAACTLYDGGAEVTGPVSIPAGGTSLTYTCAMGAGVGSTTAGTVTVGLSWSAEANYGTSGAATGSTDFDFATVTPTVTDDSVTLTDSHYDFENHPAGNVLRATGGPRSLTYPLTWPGEAGACTTYPNTATITETDGDSQSDGARVEVCEGKDLRVAKTVVHSYHRTYAWSLTKEVVGPSTKEAGPDGTATFDYEVVATGGKATDSNWAMSGAITVENPNAWPVTLTDVTDRVDVGGGATCVVTKGADLVVAARGERTFDYSCSFATQPSYDGTNTATVSWDGTQHVSPSTSASGTAAVEAEKWERADYDKTITVIDDKTDPANPVTLGTATWAGEGVSKVFPYTGPALAGTRGECVDYTNTAWIEELPTVEASATATVCAAADITVAKDVDATYDTTYSWNITKDVDSSRAEVEPGATGRFDYTVVAEPAGSQDTNWAMSGTITVTNPNTYKDVTVELTDEYDGGGVCTPELATVEVPAESSTLVRYTCHFESRPEYSGTNKVTATWEGRSTEATAEVDFRQVGKVDYEVDVYDDLTVPDGTPEWLGRAVWDAPLGERTFENSLDLGGAPGQCVDHTNTAWVDVEANDVTLFGAVVAPAVDPFAQQTVTVCERTDLTVTKDAEATYDTRYFWSISKGADRSYAEVGPGETARFDYTVVARPNGSEDGNWNLSGTITLTNANTFEAVTATLSDAYDGGGECTPESTTVEVPQATRIGDTVVPGTAEVRYDCDFAAEPKYSGTGTVTASWDGKRAQASAPVTFRQVGRTDYEVDVYDDLTDPEGTPKWLGEAAWGAPESERTFGNSLDLGAAPGQCLDHTNTAWAGSAEERLASAQKTVTVCETGALTVIKDAKASYDTTYLWDIEKSVTPEAAEIPAGAEQELAYSVRAVPRDSVDSGWDLTGTITVSNPNAFKSVEATLVDVYDNGTADPADDVECTVTYPGGLDRLVVPEATRTGPAVTPGTASAAYDCDFASKPSYSGENHVTVSWGDGRSDSFVKPVVFEQDETVDETVTVYDDKVDLATPEELGKATWRWDAERDRPIATVFPTYTLSKGGVAGECTDYTNTAHVDLAQQGVANPEVSATATLCVEDELKVTKTVQASFGRSYDWLIDKSVDDTRLELTDDGDATFHYTVKATPDGWTDSEYTMGGTVTVTNPNTYADGAITAQVTDVPDVGGGAACTVAGGQSVTLEPGQTKTLSYACSFTGRPQNGTNSATARWTGPDQEDRSSSSGAVPVRFTPTGGANSKVEVTDSLTSQSVLGTAYWNSDQEPTVFEYHLTHEGDEGRCVDYTNTARITQTGQSDSETVTVCDQDDLVVTKTAHASYDRTYDWDITKVADRTRVETEGGGTATVSYAVGVTPDGYTDSDWEMSGAVTVLNPNEYKSVTVDLDDRPDLGEGATCDFDEDEDLVVEADEKRTFTYTCSFEGKPAYDGSNTVIVEWDKGRVSARTDVSFERDHETNRTVTVTDDRVDPSELGQVTWDESEVFEYALDLEAPVGACETVTNTAAIVETGQQATAEVVVCGDEVTDDEKPRPKPPVEPPPVRPEPPVAGRPPVLLPSTGAPAGAGLWSTLGGLMIAVGAAMLLRRRRVS